MIALAGYSHSSGNRLINLPKQLNLLGLLLLIEAAFMSVPFIFCLFTGEEDWKSFLLAIMLTAVCGLVLKLAVKPRSEN